MDEEGTILAEASAEYPVHIRNRYGLNKILKIGGRQSSKQSDRLSKSVKSNRLRSKDWSVRADARISLSRWKKEGHSKGTFVERPKDG